MQQVPGAPNATNPSQPASQIQSPDNFFDQVNSAQKVAQSVGNMTMTEADISKELGGAGDDPFNLTASSNRG